MSATLTTNSCFPQRQRTTATHLGATTLTQRGEWIHAVELHQRLAWLGGGQRHVQLVRARRDGDDLGHDVDLKEARHDRAPLLGDQLELLGVLRQKCEQQKERAREEKDLFADVCALHRQLQAEAVATRCQRFGVRDDDHDGLAHGHVGQARKVQLGVKLLLVCGAFAGQVDQWLLERLRHRVDVCVRVREEGTKQSKQNVLFTVNEMANCEPPSAISGNTAATSQGEEST